MVTVITGRKCRPLHPIRLGSISSHFRKDKEGILRVPALSILPSTFESPSEVGHIDMLRFPGPTNLVSCSKSGYLERGSATGKVRTWCDRGEAP
jgi:hypothetical protein